MQQPRRACDCPLAGGAGSRDSQPATGGGRMGPLWQSAVKCYLFCFGVFFSIFKATQMPFRNQSFSQSGYTVD